MIAARGDRLVELAGARGWGGALLTPGVNFRWLTGAALERSERLVALGVPVVGGPWIVCPAFEADRIAALVPGPEILPWAEHENPFALAAGAMAESQRGRWAVEPSTSFHDARRLEAANGPLEDGAPVFEDLRRRKDAAERAAIERAIGAAWEVHDEVLPELAAGATERDAAAALEAAFAARGYDGWALVQFGPDSALPHAEPGDRRLEPGAVVLVDWGGWGEGFTADLSRTYWWDGGIAPEAAAPADVRAILDLVRSAQAAALSAMRPGVRCGDVDEAARAPIRDAGHGDRFVHRLGHGLGLEIHEPPYLVAGSDDRLRPGDVVTVEPGVYLPARFGVRWEDDVLVTEDGVEVLSRRS